MTIKEKYFKHQNKIMQGTVRKTNLIIHGEHVSFEALFEIAKGYGFPNGSG